jgi:hypothetical protein
MCIPNYSYTYVLFYCVVAYLMCCKTVYVLGTGGEARRIRSRALRKIITAVVLVR